MKLSRTITTGIAALLMWTAVQAATVTVINTNESGPGSLRAALASSGNGDTIDATAVTGTITLAVTELVVSNSVNILGPGPDFLFVDGNPTLSTTNRVFHITNSASVVIANLTITNGAVLGSFPGNSGGGIWNDHSTLTVSNCVVSRNQCGSGVGGGVFNDGSSGNAALFIVGCTFSSNRGSSGGGGIYNYAPGGTASVSILASTFKGNTGASGGGGGIFNAPGGGNAIVMISNSTFNANITTANGAGIANVVNSGTGMVTVIASTFSGNSAGSSGFGGGVYNNAGATANASALVIACTFTNTAANFGGGNIYNTGSGIAKVEIGNTILVAPVLPGNIVGSGIVSDGYNLCGDSGAGVLTNTTDQINTDPLLGPLTDNGGPTLTMALRVGSPAIDKGRSFGLTTDQRGQPRLYDNSNIANATGGDGADIGAYEAAELRITAVQKIGNNLRLDFLNWLGTNYEVQSRSDLTTGSWGSAGFTNAGNGGIASATVSNAFSVPQQFYRIHPVP